MDQKKSKSLEQFRDRRKFDRKDMAEQGVAVFEDGTRVPCIIHDMSEGKENDIFGMRVELLNVSQQRTAKKLCNSYAFRQGNTVYTWVVSTPIVRGVQILALSFCAKFWR